ncbi:ATP-binding protein [Saccharothrix deserti]|uniref:ATP-binding protein n=1 Tax=Saccharothrix deserti TaxID=2593674 RepID=UPI00131CC4D0|nr:ATP-binding protein [Saccharothrix deserti]
MSDELVLDVLAEWPQRWRYPALAKDAAAGLLDVDTATRYVLEGLARPRTPAESLADLVGEGRFEQADVLLIELLDVESPQDGAAWLGAGEWSAAEKALAGARDKAVAEVSREWSDLAVRAKSVDVDLPGEPALLDLARKSLPEARDVIARHDEEVTAAERELGERIEARLADALVTAGREPAVRSWENAVRECLRAGEFRVADRLVSGGPYGTTEAGPRAVARPPLTWPWPNHPVPEVLGWYGDPWAMPGPDFARFRIEPGDDAHAFELIGHIARIAENPDAPSVRDFATALAAVLGETVALEVDEVDGKAGFRTTLFGLSDPRLPNLPMLGSRGVALWVGDERAGDDSSPPESAEPVIWFRPFLVAPQSGRPEVTTLDIATLLRVLAPDDRLPVTLPTERRINLLRLLVPHLAPSVVLGHVPAALGRGASPRDSLAWLFDLFGLLPDGPVLDSLLHDSDEHPIVLGQLLAAVLRHRPRDGRVGPAELAVARTAEVRSAARARVLDALADQPAAKAVLMLILWQFDGDESVHVDRVVDGIGTVELPQDITSWLRDRLPVGKALDTLAAHGLVRPLGDGVFALPGPGVRDLLRGLNGPRGLRDDLVAALDEAAERLRQARLANAALIAERVIRLIGHRVDNDVIAVLGWLDRARAATTDPDVATLIDNAIERLGTFGGGTYVAAYEAALAQPEAVEVHDLVRTVIGDVEWHLSPGSRLADVSADTRPVLVWTNRYIMHENLRNLVLNASRALGRRTSQDQGVIAVDVRRTAAGDPATPAGMSSPCVVIEVNDNGPGFTPEHLARYRGIIEQGDAARDLGSGTRHGTGIRQAVAWLADYDGRLELPDRSSARFDGGCVRIWLPAYQDPSSGGTS